MPGGRTPTVGDIFRNPDLASSLTLISRQGSDAFYKGSLAETVVGFLQRQGSAMTKADFVEYVRSGNIRSPRATRVGRFIKCRPMDPALPRSRC